MNYKDALSEIGIHNVKSIFWDLPISQLVEESLLRKEGKLAENGALVVETGNPTGRSPKDKYIVETEGTSDVWWGEVNKKIDEKTWKKLKEYICCYFQLKDLFVFNGFAGADPNYRIQVRVITEKAWHSLFSKTLFIQPKSSNKLANHPDFTVINACNFKLNNYKDLELNSEKFIVINFKEKVILIAGTHYAGEIKKSIFTVMNYLLPKKGVLSMHCSANVGNSGDCALFFGLSGTGKTTLSADPKRKLIGDDEHGWSESGIFNFEGGCYAKCIKLSKESEPQIYNALKFGSVLENVVLKSDRTPNYDDDSITENTRATYPITHIDNCVHDGVGSHPSNIFFLAADAFGIFPPIAKLNADQAMYHFLSGYTAKLAGTEAGVIEPIATFSACFGAPFLVLHPFVYAQMLAEKINKHKVNVWLVNTGWSGGPYGVGSRMKIAYTRILLNAALDGELNNVEYTIDPIFGLAIPKYCPNIPSEILNPKNTWKNKSDYDNLAKQLALKFKENFNKFAEKVTSNVLNAGPKV